MKPTDHLSIIGAGGKGGSGGGAEEDPDTLRSKSLISIIDAISEGEIDGFYYRNEDGEMIKAETKEDVEKCVFFNEVPIRSNNGTVNFPLTEFGYTVGTQDQVPVPSADTIQSVRAIEVTIRHDSGPYVLAISQDLTEVILNIGTGPLAKTDNDDGDIHGSQITFSIEVNYDGVGWDIVETPSGLDRWTIKGKTRDTYTRSITIILRSAATGNVPYTNAQIRITRITLDPTAAGTVNPLVLKSVTEVQRALLTYPNTVLVGMTADSEKFTNVPERGYSIRGIKVKVPLNYNPLTREYATSGPGTTGGVWDGTFKVAWTDNPAWVFYDIVTERRYGLGRYIDAALVDKWGLYGIAKYCDTLVSDGFGGQEPRFTCNTYLQSAEEAYTVLKNLASVFRGMVYWSAGAVVAVQDREGVQYPLWDVNLVYSAGQYARYDLKLYRALRETQGDAPPTSANDWEEVLLPVDVSCLFTRSNVENGSFRYVGTARKARHTVALVAWNDPLDFYKKKVEYVEDVQAILILGLNTAEVTAFGCTSRAQARRVGRWLLLTELYETEVVSFRAGLDAANLMPGHIIAVSDPLRSQERLGGRLLTGSTDMVLKLDSSVALKPDTEYHVYVVNPASTLTPGPNQPAESGLDDLIITAPILPPAANGSFTEITCITPLSTVPKPGATWILTTDVALPQTFRVLSRTEPRPNVFEITATAHASGKYLIAESDADFHPTPVFNLPNPFDVHPPSNIIITAEFQAAPHTLVRRLNVRWTASDSPMVSYYSVDYTYANRNWQAGGTSQTTELSFDVVAADVYEIRLRAVNNIGQYSAYVYATFDLASQILANSSITGLELIDQGNDTVFLGRNPRFVWRFNSPDTDIGLGDAAQGLRHPLLRGYIVQIINPVTLRVVHQEEVPDPTFTYTYEQNVADNLGTPLREFTIKVAGIDRTNFLTRAAELTVQNPAPLLGGIPPLITDNIRFAVSSGLITVNITPPADVDFQGFFVWVGYANGMLLPTLDQLQDLSGNLTANAFVRNDSAAVGPLIYLGNSSLVTFRPAPSPFDGTDQRVFIAVAAFDAFGNFGLNVYGFFEVVLSLTVDNVPPQTPNLHSLRTSSVVGNDGTEITVFQALFYPGGVSVAQLSTDWQAPDTDLESYLWSLRQVTGAPLTYIDNVGTYTLPQLHTPITGDVPARGSNGSFAKVLDPDTGLYLVKREWTVVPNTGYEVRIAARDSSGNVSGYTPLDFNAYLISARDTTAPLPPHDGEVHAAYRTIFIDWINTTERDLFAVRIYIKIGDSPTPPVWQGSYWVADSGDDQPMPITAEVAASAFTLGALDTPTGTRYHVWLTSIDFSGNESRPGPGGPGIHYAGSAALGSIPPTDVTTSFDITALFGDVVTMDSLDLVNNSNNGLLNSAAGSIWWNAHYLNHKGLSHRMQSGTTALGYVYWNPTALLYNVAQWNTVSTYATGNFVWHQTASGERRKIYIALSAVPANTNPASNPAFWAEHTSAYGIFAAPQPAPTTPPHYLVFTNTGGIADRRWFYAANAVLGSAWIENAAILNAMINNLNVDKLRSGTITATDIYLAYGIVDGNPAAGARIRAGLATAYGVGTGLWMGIDTDTVAKFRFGDPAGTNPVMYWDGSALTVRGTLFSLSGVIGGLNVDATKMWIGTGTWNNTNTAFYADNAGNFSLKNNFYWDAATSTLKAGHLFVTPSSLYAFTSGGANDPANVNNWFYIDSNGWFRIKTYIVFNPLVPSLTINASGTFSGALSAVSGSFSILGGGLLVVGNNTSRQAYFEIIGPPNNPHTTLPIMVFDGGDGSPAQNLVKGLWIGHSDPTVAPFFVNLNGDITAANLILTEDNIGIGAITQTVYTETSTFLDTGTGAIFDSPFVRVMTTAAENVSSAIYTFLATPALTLNETDATGRRVLITGTVHLRFNGGLADTATMKVILRRNNGGVYTVIYSVYLTKQPIIGGTEVISTAGGSYSVNILPQHFFINTVDNPNIGTYTYELVLKNMGGLGQNNSLLGRYSYRFLAATLVKR